VTGPAGPVTSIDGEDSPTPVVPPKEASALPWSEGELAYALATPPARWFYDITAASTARGLRNDLSGALVGEVQFVQSHAAAPAGNDARELPRPVALREALVLLLTDGKPAGADPVKDKMLVTARRNGVVLGTQRMRPPVLLPRSDNGAMDGRGDVGYSKRAWSSVLPYEWMRPGLELEFSFVAASGDSSSGKLAANSIEFGAPTELVVQNIRLGMLTPPNAKTGYLMQQPERAGTDYFQTLPISRLTVAQYQDVQLDRVIVSTGGGAIYTTSNPSPQNGGVYDGDMREDVAKVQVAQGINLANYGLVDSLINETSPETFSQRVVHHARGLYANGVVDHGLSGGNGMITLYNSIGNEFSHEMGHSYGLGHYPGLSADAKNPVHHADSGWGYIGWRQRLRGNLKWNSAFDPRGTDNSGSSYYSGNFDGVFNYGADAMSGGSTQSAFSQYTHHTGYSARRIQSYLSTARSGGARAIPDPTYPSGWRAWDPASGEWVDRSRLSPAFSAPKPSAAGVSVVTILGGYQTVNPGLNLVYPGFFGSWGVVYDNLAQPASEEGACWLEVSLASGTPLRVALTPSKSASEPPRKFHLNVAASRQPREAAIKCRTAAGETTLAQQALGAPVAPFPATVDVGMERGMTALRDMELAQLNSFLEKKTVGSVLDADQQEILLQWRNQLNSMSVASQAWIKDWLEVREKTLLLNAHVRTERGLLQPTASATGVAQLRKQAVALGLLDNQGTLLKPTSAALRLQSNGSCLSIDDPGSDMPKLLSESTQTCKSTAQQQWWMDGQGRIHNAARPDLCLRTDGGWYSAITLGACQLQDRGQAFVQQESGRLQAVNYDNRSIEAGSPVHIMNNDESSSKSWSKLPSDSRALWTLLESDSLLALWRQFGADAKP